MDWHRLDSAHLVTPGLYQCPACLITMRMRIQWPYWECPSCQCRLVPTDQPQHEGSPALQIVVESGPPSPPVDDKRRRSSFESAD